MEWNIYRRTNVFIDSERLEQKIIRSERMVKSEP